MCQVGWFALYLKQKNDLWKEGEIMEVHSLKEFKKSQFWLQLTGLGFGILFRIVGPVLFLPVCRGSLINTFLGVKYGTAIKWHRWVGCQTLLFIIVHGILYHALWASDSAQMYRDEAFRFEYAHYFSNGAGLVAWCGVVVIAITCLPAFRRNFYWVRSAFRLMCMRARDVLSGGCNRSIHRTRMVLLGSQRSYPRVGPSNGLRPF